MVVKTDLCAWSELREYCEKFFFFNQPYKKVLNYLYLDTLLTFSFPPSISPSLSFIFTF